MKKAKKDKKIKKLTRSELLELENGHLNQQIHNMELNQIKLQTELEQSKKIILAYQIKEAEQGIILLKSLKETVENKRSNGKAKYAKIIERIQKRLKIKEKFGYDPDSGEIDENTE